MAQESSFSSPTIGTVANDLIEAYDVECKGPFPPSRPRPAGRECRLDSAWSKPGAPGLQ